tara:strand:+ start:19 stop:570 length:552 start_codon:yes stop_codon:yes gene_type:complete
MASELQVTTIKGVPTGANSNQILVGSGQTLHAPGHSLQTVSGEYSTAGSTTSTSVQTIWSGVSITPKFANSLIHVQVNWYAMHRDYYDGYLQLSKNGSLFNQMIVVRNAAHTGGSFVHAESRTIWYSPIWTWNFTETAGTTSQLTYGIKGWTQDGSQPLMWNQAPNNSNVTPTSTIILTEIAQ